MVMEVSTHTRTHTMRIGCIGLSINTGVSTYGSFPPASHILFGSRGALRRLPEYPVRHDYEITLRTAPQSGTFSLQNTMR